MKAILRDEEGFQLAKQEEEKNSNETSRNVTPRLVPSTTSTSRQWAGFRNPRIVRVSRSFGGKDRHSKVCTIRGLRDRRIRLSVPTAIQLYDLQDKLGLSQPSKVIDWLLDASKEDIDKLPPLQMPTSFGQFHQQFLLPHESLSSVNNSSPSTMISSFFPTTSSAYLKHGIKINENSVDHGAINNESSSVSAFARSTKYWDMDAYGLRAKNKGVGREDDDLHHQPLCEKGKWIETNDDQVHGHAQQVSAQNFFPIMSYSSLGGLTNNSLPYSYINQWEPSNLSLSQFGSHGLQLQSENPLNSTPLASSSTLPSAGSSQLYLCPSATMKPVFPSYPSYLTSSVETDPRQLNHHHHLQILSSSSQQHALPTSLMPSLQLIGSSIKFPFQTNVNAKLLHRQGNDENEEDEDGNDS